MCRNLNHYGVNIITALKHSKQLVIGVLIMNYKECINIVSGYIKKNSFSRNLETGIYFSCLNFNLFFKYAELNKKDIEMFNACIDTFIQILLYKSSDSINTVDELYSSCDKLLYVIEDDDGILSDECINVVCQVMHLLLFLKSHDNIEIVDIIKLYLENNDAYYQKCNYSTEEYNNKLELLYKNTVRFCNCSES